MFCFRDEINRGIRVSELIKGNERVDFLNFLIGGGEIIIKIIKKLKRKYQFQYRNAGCKDRLIGFDPFQID